MKKKITFGFLIFLAMIAFVGTVWGGDVLGYVLLVFTYFLIFGGLGYLVHRFAKGKIKTILYIVLAYLLLLSIADVFFDDRITDTAIFIVVAFITACFLFFVVSKLHKIAKDKGAFLFIKRTTANNQCDDYNEELDDYEEETPTLEERIDIDTMDGTIFEHFCADLLRVNGWTDIRVTPGSGDHGIDITAEKDDIKWGFQCKRWNGTKVDAIAIGQTFKGKAIYKCDMVAIITTSTLTAQAESEAQQLGIKVWGRGKIRQLMDKLDNADNYYLSA